MQATQRIMCPIVRTFLIEKGTMSTLYVRGILRRARRLHGISFKLKRVQSKHFPPRFEIQFVGSRVQIGAVREFIRENYALPDI